MLLRSVIIVYTDCIDIMVDHVPHSEYKKEEDRHIHNSKNQDEVLLVTNEHLKIQ